MGSSSSISGSCESIEDTMNSMIFLPPDTPKEYFNRLKTTHCKLLSVKSKIGNKIWMTKHIPSGNYNKYLIYSHGNASDIYDMDNYFETICDRLNVCVIGYDYVGYGLSEGDPTEQNAYDSHEAVVNFVINELKIDPKDVILCGQSLGTGIVVDYISKNKWNSPVILISPYETIGTVVLGTSAICFSPIDKFKSTSKISKVTCPIKIFHGEKDTLINISHAKKLYNQLINKALAPIWIPDATHNNILDLIDMMDLSEAIYYSA